jgi:motility quorum-sensing regulator/GCU-specific mRNA interferase toxin
MKKPSYELEEIKELLQEIGTRIITKSSRQDAVKLGYADDAEMVNRILKITSKDFFKTMPAEKSPFFQDVYYTWDGTKKIYIKLQKSLTGKGVIISFKETI